MAATSVHTDFDRLVFTYEDSAPTEQGIDEHFVQARSTTGIKAVELVVLPEFTSVLLDGLLDRGFQRVGTVSIQPRTWMRWVSRFETEVKDVDPRLVKMNAGFNGLVK
jgi:hypothetical protein